MARSEKPAVIERIFETLWDPEREALTRSVVTNQDVSDAIRWCRQNQGISLSDKNPANFLKDIIRGKRASMMWPESLKERRITARQVTGNGNIFEFVPYETGQEEPFPDRFCYRPGVWTHQVQTISMPLATKALGRDDETYLIQVAVKLNVVETHFALRSPLDVVELTHLQIGIKLRLCEVDSLFAATYRDSHGELKQLIITAEAKAKSQRILEEQVIQQMRAAFNETDVDLVVPIALAAVDGGIYVAEFQAVPREQANAVERLELATEAMYALRPPINGM